MRGLEEAEALSAAPARVQAGAPLGPQPRRRPRGPRGRQSPAQVRRRLCQTLPAQQAVPRTGARGRAGALRPFPRAGGRGPAHRRSPRPPQGGARRPFLRRPRALRPARPCTREDVRTSVRAQYDYVFVDEYQDVSDVQEALITAVSARRTSSPSATSSSPSTASASPSRASSSPATSATGAARAAAFAPDAQLPLHPRGHRLCQRRLFPHDDRRRFRDRLRRPRPPQRRPGGHGRRAPARDPHTRRGRRARAAKPTRRWRRSAAPAARPCGSPAASASSWPRNPACATATSPSSPAPRARRRPPCCPCCSPRASPPTPRAFPAISTRSRSPSRSRFCGWWTMNFRMWR